MSEKLEAVRMYYHAEGTEGGYYTAKDVDEFVADGCDRADYIPVAIVPIPESGEVREMWEYGGLLCATREQVEWWSERALPEPGTLPQPRPVTVIDREVTA